MKRNEAIAKIKAAYENKQLGFQKGADGCLYYDSETDSCCAIGVLIDPKDRVLDDKGNACHLFAITLTPDNDRIQTGVAYSLKRQDLDSFHGLTTDECLDLQALHDDLINSTRVLDDSKFASFLYGLSNE